MSLSLEMWHMEQEDIEKEIEDALADAPIEVEEVTEEVEQLHKDVHPLPSAEENSKEVLEQEGVDLVKDIPEGKESQYGL